MTTPTPNRDALTAAAAEARRIHADAIARDDVEGIRLRMAIEAAEAVLGGAADLLDREVDVEVVWPAVGFALARVLTGFLMTVTRGDAGRSAGFVPGAVGSVQELALARLTLDPGSFVLGTIGGDHPTGGA